MARYAQMYFQEHSAGIFSKQSTDELLSYTKVRRAAGP